MCDASFTNSCKACQPLPISIPQFSPFRCFSYWIHLYYFLLYVDLYAQFFHIVFFRRYAWITVTQYVIDCVLIPGVSSALLSAEVFARLPQLSVPLLVQSLLYSIFVKNNWMLTRIWSPLSKFISVARLSIIAVLTLRVSCSQCERGTLN